MEIVFGGFVVDSFSLAPPTTGIFLAIYVYDCRVLRTGQRALQTPDGNR